MNNLTPLERIDIRFNMKGINPFDVDGKWKFVKENAPEMYELLNHIIDKELSWLVDKPIQVLYRFVFLAALLTNEKKEDDGLTDIVIESLQKRIKELETALIAMRIVMDNGPMPQRLDDALTWRECDIKARAMCDAALKEVINL